MDSNTATARKSHAMESRSPTAIGELFTALCFAADKHRDQRRKGKGGSPYINHPIEVAELLVRVGGVSDTTTLQAAILHDTIEDTETTARELDATFGPLVRQLVEEVSDDKSLPKEERKRLQVVHGPGLSRAAREIKIADKICNVRDVSTKPPEGWPLDRQVEYLAWSERVVAACHGVNTQLEKEFANALAEARDVLTRRGEDD